MIIKQEKIGEYVITLRKTPKGYTVKVNSARTTTKSEAEAHWLYNAAIEECKKEVRTQ